VHYVHSVHRLRSGCTAVAPDRLAGKDEIPINRGKNFLVWTKAFFSELLNLQVHSAHIVL